MTMSCRGWCIETRAVVNRPSGPAPWIATEWVWSMRPAFSTALTTVRRAQLAAEAQVLSTSSGTRIRPARGRT